MVVQLAIAEIGKIITSDVVTAWKDDGRFHTFLAAPALFTIIAWLIDDTVVSKQIKKELRGETEGDETSETVMKESFQTWWHQYQAFLDVMQLEQVEDTAVATDKCDSCSTAWSTLSMRCFCT